MTRVKIGKKTAVGVAGALLVGAAILAVRKIFDFEIDIDPWEEAFPG